VALIGKNMQTLHVISVFQSISVFQIISIFQLILIFQMNMIFPFLASSLDKALLQILGLVGSARKRTLILCQAVEFSRNNNMTASNTLQVLTTPLLPNSACVLSPPTLA